MISDLSYPSPNVAESETDRRELEEHRLRPVLAELQFDFCHLIERATVSPSGQEREFYHGGYTSLARY
jgi:hypothetical protein